MQEQNSGFAELPFDVCRSAAYNVWMASLTADTRTPKPVRYAYTSSKSSKGLESLSSGAAHFAAVNTALSKQTTDAFPKLWMVPSLGGAVAIVFNVPGIPSGQLNISRENLVDVFLGKIRLWSGLAKDNPSLVNVHRNISLIVRQDSAGTSEVLTLALSSFSAEWKASVGTSTCPTWPVAYKQVTSSSAVAIGVLLQEYSLGYILVGEQQTFQVPVARISNKAGTFTLPTGESVAAAMDAFSPALADAAGGNTTIFFTPIVDPPSSAPDAYPISMFVYVVFDEERLGCSTLFSVLYFVVWSWTDRDAGNLAVSENFAQVLEPVYEVLLGKLRAIKCCSGNFVMASVEHTLNPTVAGEGTPLA
jgi:phosphate transport system substrate-binding protein